MNVDAATIERMVREVLSQAQPRTAVRDNAVTTAPEKLLTVPAVSTTPAESKQTPPATVIPDRIITADLLAESVKPGAKIVIAKRAIITPAANDYLRNNRITFERQETTQSGSSQESVRWKILVSGVAEHTVRAVDTVCQQRHHVTRDIIGTATEAANLAISAICRAEVTGVIVVTGSPEVSACRANRNTSIRAAVVSDLQSWLRIQSQLRPNVVCISPQGRSFMELQNVLNKVVTGSAPEAPSDWV